MVMANWPFYIKKKLKEFLIFLRPGYKVIAIINSTQAELCLIRFLQSMPFSTSSLEKIVYIILYGH